MGTRSKTVIIGGVKVGGRQPLVFIGGPCVIESEEHSLMMARELKAVTSSLGIGFIFKSSYDKANRSSLDSYRGPGLEEGLRILRKVRQEVGVPVLSDVHSPEQVEKASEVLDCLQIPAFLCRQTDLLLEAGRSGKPVNIKKGQFLSPYEVKSAVDKILSTGNDQVTLTERGTTFGYNNLVVDMRSLVILGELGYPIVFDGTHSVQLPGAGEGKSGGQREFVAPLCRAAVAVGVDAVFLEVHDEPEKALCDGPNMVKLAQLEALLKKLREIYQVGS
jgi:2-dehydro-3-deoxyphosphooctonate aldolase (KDO 8-P synthase)